MKLETVPIASLTQDPDNARRHPEGNLNAIRHSLDRFGQVLPLVVRNGVVVGGNGTLRALRDLGKEQVHVVDFDGTLEEAKALAIALNRSGELARWDAQTLGDSLVQLADFGFEPDTLGFTDAALEDLFPVTDAEYREPIKDLGGEKEAAKDDKPPPAIQYALIFDDEKQQKRFISFLGRLKKAHPEAKTVAARLDLFIGAARPSTK